LSEANEVLDAVADVLSHDSLGDSEKLSEIEEAISDGEEDETDNG
jgi:hypothetical protein